MTDEIKDDEINDREALLLGLHAYEAALPEYTGPLATWHNTIGDARTDEKLALPIDATLAELVEQGGMVVLGRGALREIIKQLSSGNAALDVYAFTLEFVLLMEGCNPNDGILKSQIKAARDAYKELTGDDPETMYRRNRDD